MHISVESERREGEEKKDREEGRKGISSDKAEIIRGERNELLKC